MPKERLHKILAHAGVASRRAAEALIAEGRVTVNGHRITTPGVTADAALDRIVVDGKPIRAEQPVYLMLHKPSGTVSTVRDPEGRRTVLDLIHPAPARLYPVGRLDWDAEGLMLLTNDGELAHRLTHPRFEIPKVYRVEVEGSPSPEALAKFRAGLKIEGGKTAPARVVVVADTRKGAVLEITIHEGRQHQVKRMCEAIGHPVCHLERVILGPLRLGTLKRGAWRPLTQVEVRELRRAAGLKEAPREARAPQRPGRRSRP